MARRKRWARDVEPRRRHGWSRSVAVPATRSPGEVRSRSGWPARAWTSGAHGRRRSLTRVATCVAFGVGPRSVGFRPPSVPRPSGRRQHCRHRRRIWRRAVEEGRDRDDGGTHTSRRRAVQHGARHGHTGAGAADRRRQGGDVIHQGSCTGSTDWKLKLSEEDGGIEVEFEVDENQNGHTWDVTLKRNGSAAWTGQRRLKAPSGSFEARRVISDGAGADKSRRTRHVRRGGFGGGALRRLVGVCTGARWGAGSSRRTIAMSDDR